ncbi:MAG: hypothetical protein WBA01_16605 [Phormidesmis sp.]
MTIPTAYLGLTIEIDLKLRGVSRDLSHRSAISTTVLPPIAAATQTSPALAD